MNLAYIDPGSGSMILQMILGGLAAAAVFLKMFWHRILVFLGIRKPEEIRERPDREAAGRAVDEGALERAGEPVGKR
ncbi:MAG TPA: hypothetical protein VHF67_07925 [Gaiellaceae bacterium]|jgi:hypothetical protein|nr:hypothetical protein [Gaiellaceae bacterium]